MELLGIRKHKAELFPYSDVLTKFLQKAFGSNSWVVKNLKIKLLLCVLNRQPLGFLDAAYSSMSKLLLVDIPSRILNGGSVDLGLPCNVNSW